MYARHGRSSQLMLAGSNIVGSLIRFDVELPRWWSADRVAFAVQLHPGCVHRCAGRFAVHELWSGFRASVLTDFVQLIGMLGAVAVLVPFIFFAAGFPAAFESGAGNLTAEQGNFFSSVAFFEQGAPYIAAVLAYAIGNQTIAQRLFAVREDLIKPTFITATVGYGATVIGVGMLGVLALYLGIEPMDGDVNNLIPQMAASYLPGILLAVFFVMIIGALSSTADSDLAALSSIVMTDVYGQAVAGKADANPRRMLLIGGVTMIVATAAAISLASLQLSILDLLVFVGALWGDLVFPVIASFYWAQGHQQSLHCVGAGGSCCLLARPIQLGADGWDVRDSLRHRCRCRYRSGAGAHDIWILRSEGCADRRWPGDRAVRAVRDRLPAATTQRSADLWWAYATSVPGPNSALRCPSISVRRSISNSLKQRTERLRRGGVSCCRSVRKVTVETSRRNTNECSPTDHLCSDLAGVGLGRAGSHQQGILQGLGNCSPQR